MAIANKVKMYINLGAMIKLTDVQSRKKYVFRHETIPAIDIVRQQVVILKIKDKLSQIELEELSAKCYTQLLVLNSRYTPEINLAEGIPLQSEYIDVLRGLWLNDNSSRPAFSCLVEGIGYVFGLILCNIHGFDWQFVDYEGVEYVSLVKVGKDQEIVSVPPFSYVQKRETLQNVEVFSDFFRHSDVVNVIA